MMVKIMKMMMKRMKMIGADAEEEGKEAKMEEEEEGAGCCKKNENTTRQYWLVDYISILEQAYCDINLGSIFW